MDHLKLPDLKIDKENPEDDIRDLVKKIKPQWNVDNLILEKVIGGYSSIMYKCFMSEEDTDDDALIIRIQNLMDRFEAEWTGRIENKVIEHMSMIGHFPKIHAIFSNGYCYQYIIGKPVINARLKTGKMTEEIIKAISEELAFVHSIKLPDTSYDSIPYYEKLKDTIRKTEFKNVPKQAPTKETLYAEIDIIDEYMRSLNSPIVLCHGDTHPGNFVWNDKTKKITFVDWEMSRIGYEMQEIAHSVVIITMFDPAVNTNSKVEIPEGTEEMFLKSYYEARSKYSNLKEYTYEDFLDIVKKYKLGSMLGGVIFPLIVPDLMEELMEGIDYHDIYGYSLNGYLQIKKQFLGTDRFG